MTLAVVPEYNPGDIAVINAIIDNNGLEWEKCLNPGVNSAWMSANWPQANWSDDAADKRILVLIVAEQNLTGALDVSGLTNLKGLDCSENNLTALNVTGLLQLEGLGCSFNNLTALHLTGLTKLKVLSCRVNNLTALNLSGLTKLEELGCSTNNLTELNLTGLANLWQVNVSHNRFVNTDAVTGVDSIPAFALFGEWDQMGYATIDLGFGEQTVWARFFFSPQKSIYNPGDIAVINAIIKNNGLDSPECPYTDGDVGIEGNWMNAYWPGAYWSEDTADKRLIQLCIGSAGLTGTLDASGLDALGYLDCGGNNLTGIKLSGLANLGTLDCWDNDLTELDLTGLTNLGELYCTSNNLTALNLTGLTNLGWLECENNNLTELDVSGLMALYVLDCSKNPLTELRVIGLPKLSSLTCYGNNLTKLELSDLPDLYWLICDDNNLTALDLSGLISLRHVQVADNYFANTDAVTGMDSIPAFVQLGEWDNPGYVDYKGGQMWAVFTFSPQKPLPFVPVTNITGIPAKTTERASLTLTGAVAPTNATNRTIVWSVKDAGTTGATISGNVFTTTGVGTAVITATIENGLAEGSDFVKDFTIVVVLNQRGDANCDGNVDAADAAAILRHLVQLKLLTPQGEINAKVTSGTGPISAADAARILRWLVQLEKTL